MTLADIGALLVATLQAVGVGAVVILVLIILALVLPKAGEFVPIGSKVDLVLMEPLTTKKNTKTQKKKPTMNRCEGGELFDQICDMEEGHYTERDACLILKQLANG